MKTGGASSGSILGSANSVEKMMNKNKVNLVISIVIFLTSVFLVFILLQLLAKCVDAYKKYRRNVARSESRQNEFYCIVNVTRPEKNISFENDRREDSRIRAQSSVFSVLQYFKVLKIKVGLASGNGRLASFAALMARESRVDPIHPQVTQEQLPTDEETLQLQFEDVVPRPPPPPDYYQMKRTILIDPTAVVVTLAKDSGIEGHKAESCTDLTC